MAFTKIATLEELPPGTLIEVLYEGEPFAVCNVGGQIRVLSGVCPHNGGPLGQGALEGPMITCPWHCWQFDSATGTCISGDEVGDHLAVETYEVKVEDGDVFAELPEDA
jgi:nitrite reductase (NADH) small subunit